MLHLQAHCPSISVATPRDDLSSQEKLTSVLMSWRSAEP